MDIFNMFSKNTCSLDSAGSEQWTWKEYYNKKKELELKNLQVILIDMIDHPVMDSVPISNQIFQNCYPDGTYFVLYCHSGRTSGSMQKKLTAKLPQYKFINMAGGIDAYHPESK